MNIKRHTNNARGSEANASASAHANANPRTAPGGGYDVENARAQMRKGFLDFPVLLIIGSEPVYASDIIERLHAAGLALVEGTLYPLLSRLTRSGLVAYEWRESPTGPPRKYYSLTKAGEAVVSELEDSWRMLNKTITTLTKAYEKSH